MGWPIAEGQPGTVNARIPAYISNGWARRAVTLRLKAEQLLSDMLAVVGADDPLTDHADNIVHDADEISDLLARGRKLAAKSQGSSIGGSTEGGGL